MPMTDMAKMLPNTPVQSQVPLKNLLIYNRKPNHQLKSVGVNNPLLQSVPQAGTVSYGAADADNGLTSVLSTAGSATMSYDGNHNLTYDGYNTLTYDVENRMVQAENAVMPPPAAARRTWLCRRRCRGRGRPGFRSGRPRRIPGQ